MIQVTAEARFVRLPADAILAFGDALAEGRTADEAAQLLRQTGFRAGEPLFRALQGWIQDRHGDPLADLPAEPFWETLSAFFSDLGWGTLLHRDLHPGVAALDAEDWMEARVGGNATAPTCHLTTGILADLLNRLAEEDVAVLEVECRGHGDERCRFLFGSPQVLQTVFERISSGTDYSEVLEELR
jgi:hypothetical protein